MGFFYSFDGLHGFYSSPAAAVNDRSWPGLIGSTVALIFLLGGLERAPRPKQMWVRVRVLVEVSVRVRAPVRVRVLILVWAPVWVWASLVLGRG